MYKDPFLKFLSRGDYSKCREEYFRLHREFCLKYEYLAPSLYHPYIIPQEEFLLLKEQTEKMASILSKIAPLYLANSEVAGFFDFPETLHEWISFAPGYSCSVPISRYDGFWNGKVFKFCEFNTDGTSGLKDMTVLDKFFLQTQIGKEVATFYKLKRFDLPEAILNTLITVYEEYGGKNKPSIAIVDYTECGTIDEFLYLKDFFISRGYQAEICDLRRLELKKDGLWCGSFKMDLIYRRAVTDDILEHEKESQVFIDAYRKGAVCIVGSLRSHIVHSKLIFPFLTSALAEKYFTKEENEFIRNHVPWTKRLIDVEHFIPEIIDNKSEYFLKPHNSYATDGVICGADVSQENWTHFIEKIINMKSNPYLVQKKIDIPKHRFAVDEKGSLKEFNLKLDPYVFGNILSGFYTRISTQNIIALNHKGMLISCFPGNLPDLIQAPC